MRLWHKDLIKVLPQKQLVSQWRELSAIVGSIQKNSTPNHLLVNKVMNYDTEHLDAYARLVYCEMLRRGYKVGDKTATKIFDFCYNCSHIYKCEISFDDIYKDWHNERYLKQCFYNLQEKFDCGGISLEEWNQICTVYNRKENANVLQS